VLGIVQQGGIGIAEKSAQISHEIGQAVALPELLAGGLHSGWLIGLLAQGFQPGWQGGHGLWSFRHLESRLNHKEIGLIGMVGEDQSHPPAEATTNQDVGVQNQTLAFHLLGSIVLVSLLPLAPALEVGLKSLLIQADPLQFRLHAAASLKQPLSLIHAAVVRERHIEANRAAMAGDLDWGGGFEMGGEPGPKLPNADTGCHAVQRELCTHFRALRVRWVRNRGGEGASL